MSLLFGETMIEISKDQAKKLNKIGIPFGPGGITKTVHGHHYYLCESKRNKAALNNIAQ